MNNDFWLEIIFSRHLLPWDSYDIAAHFWGKLLEPDAIPIETASGPMLLKPSHVFTRGLSSYNTAASGKLGFLAGALGSEHDYLG